MLPLKNKTMWLNTFSENIAYDYEYFHQPNVCRLCWSLDGKTDIFKKENSLDASAKQVLAMIKAVLDLNLVEDDGPNKVCSNCYNQIESFNEFKTFCQNSDRKLQSILCAGNNSVTEKSDLVKCEFENSNLECDFKFDFHHNELVDESLNSNEVAEIVLENNQLKQKKARRRKASLCCSICDLYFKTNLEFKIHNSNFHTKSCKRKKSDKFCNICCSEFESAALLNTHNFEAHGIEVDSFKCFGCMKKFRNNRLRCRHELNFCKGLKDGYKCDVCERYLPTRKTYEVHMKNHRHNIHIELPENVFKCGKCEDSFKTRESLTIHNETTHNLLKKKFVCETCGRSFTRSDYLTKHRLTHTGIKKHKCKYCPFKAAQRSSILVHMRRHTGERPFSCDICSQRCVSSSNLQAHRRRHLGTDKFECTLCDKKFGYKASLEEHIESSHDRPQSHVCATCGATYSRIRGLKRHLAAKHGKLITTSNGNGTSNKNEDNSNKTETDLYAKMVNGDALCILTDDVNSKDVV